MIYESEKAENKNTEINDPMPDENYIIKIISGICFAVSYRTQFRKIRNLKTCLKYQCKEAC